MTAWILWLAEFHEKYYLVWNFKCILCKFWKNWFPTPSRNNSKTYINELSFEIPYRNLGGSQIQPKLKRIVLRFPVRMKLKIDSFLRPIITVPEITTKMSDFLIYCALYVEPEILRIRQVYLILNCAVVTDDFPLVDVKIEISILWNSKFENSSTTFRNIFFKCSKVIDQLLVGKIYYLIFLRQNIASYIKAGLNSFAWRKYIAKYPLASPLPVD